MTEYKNREDDVIMEYHYYLAYGSNLNLNQMLRVRCPQSKLVATGLLHDYQLLFKGQYGNCHCTIEPCKGMAVPVGLFRVTDQCINALNRYEGYPYYYHIINIDTSEIEFFNSIPNIPTAFAYVMNRHVGIAGMPSENYWNVVLQGYRDCGLDQKYLYDALDNSLGM